MPLPDLTKMKSLQSRQRIEIIVLQTLEEFHLERFKRSYSIGQIYSNINDSHPFLLWIINSISVLGLSEVIGNLDLSFSGSLQTPPAGFISNPNIIVATKDMISWNAKCLPGHRVLPPPNGLNAVFRLERWSWGREFELTKRLGLKILASEPQVFGSAWMNAVGIWMVASFLRSHRLLIIVSLMVYRTVAIPAVIRRTSSYDDMNRGHFSRIAATSTSTLEGWLIMSCGRVASSSCLIAVSREASEYMCPRIQNMVGIVFPTIARMDPTNALAVFLLLNPLRMLSWQRSYMNEHESWAPPSSKYS